MLVLVISFSFCLRLSMCLIVMRDNLSQSHSRPITRPFRVPLGGRVGGGGGKAGGGAQSTNYYHYHYHHYHYHDLYHYHNHHHYYFCTQQNTVFTYSCHFCFLHAMIHLWWYRCAHSRVVRAVWCLYIYKKNHFIIMSIYIILPINSFIHVCMYLCV